MLTSGIMALHFKGGDFLIYQIESGYGLLRVLAVEDEDNDPVWHLAAYDEFFLEVEQAEALIASGTLPKPDHEHFALTNRAFESNQVAKIAHLPLTETDVKSLKDWRDGSDREISDRSVRLLLGLR